MLSDDAELIRRVQVEDDRQAFAELVRRHQSKLRYSLRQLTGSDIHLADDLAQETFIKAYLKLGQFRADARFFTWLYRIAWRCFCDDRRRHRPGQVVAEPGHPVVADTEGDHGDLHLDFARALMKFAPRQRMVLHLHLQRGFTHREIADVIDCPLGTVKSDLQRGRERLKDYLADWQS